MFRSSRPAYNSIPGLEPAPVYELGVVSHAKTVPLDSREQRNVDKTALLDVIETTASSTHTHEADTTQQPNRWQRIAGLGRDPQPYQTSKTEPTFRGWHKAVIAAAALAGLVLVINTVFTIVVLVKSDVEGGVGLMYDGDCGLVTRWDTALHLVINLLSTALLGASSFTMQCLNSPTRDEVDVAHAKHKSLEIGLASLTNLFHVRRWKAILWLLLCLSTMPLHLFWNSAIFSTSVANLFSFVVAEESFLHGAAYQSPNDTSSELCSTTVDSKQSIGAPGVVLMSPGNVKPSDVITTIYNGYQASLYSDLTAADCLEFYSHPTYPSVRRNLIVIVRNLTTSDTMGRCGYYGSPWNGSSVVGIGMNSYPGPAWKYNFDTSDQAELEAEVKSKGTWSLGNYTVTSCKSELIASPSHCQLQAISYILYIVIVCNLVQFISMCVVTRYLWSLDQPILATVGDAASSFLEVPDETTQGLCLLGFEDLRKGVWSKDGTYNPVYRRKRMQRLYSVISHTRWWCTIVVCTSYLITGFVMWSISTENAPYSESELMKLGFGAVDSSLVIGIPGDSGSGLIVDVIVANSFQLVLSTTYFLYNSLYTAQCAALEWVSYAQGNRKALRVTWPRGQQRSTYYLHLPYRYGIPLTILLILMHFLISQSVFLARLQYYDWQGSPFYSGPGLTDVGFSPRAILTTSLVGVVLILAQIAHSFRPLNNRMPLHGNNSAVISAMCHPAPTVGDQKPQGNSSSQLEADDVATGPITWGVTRSPVASGSAVSERMDEDGGYDDGAGHCGFSADVVELPEIGKKYR